MHGLLSTVHMNKPTAHNHWRTVLQAQGRTIRWLAIQTGRSPRTVYCYSNGQRTPSAEWLALASEVLGVDVTGRAA